MIAKMKNDGGYTVVKPNLLGFAERDVIDVGEARQAFDFDLVKCPSYNSRGEVLPDIYHVERGDTGECIPNSAVGDRFRPIQHRDIYDLVCNDVLPQVPGMKLETVGTLYGSGTGFISATMGDGFRLPGDRSPHNVRLTFINPVGRGSLLLGFTTVRVFCQNCIRAAMRDIGRHEKFTIRHTEGADYNVKCAITAISAQATLANEIRLRSERLAETPVTPSLVGRVLDRVYPMIEDRMSAPSLAYNRAAREEVLFQFEAGHTAQTFTADNGWKLFNAITYPIFNPVRMKRNTDAADIMFKGQFGGRADKVGEIFDSVEDVLVAA